MDKQYRTQEQFEEIIDDMINGNWTRAGEKWEEYGFFAKDLLDYWSKSVCDLEDLVYLSEAIESNR